MQEDGEKYISDIFYTIRFNVNIAYICSTMLPAIRTIIFGKY